MQTPARDGWLTHEGVRLHYRSWGEPGRPGVLLVHGGAAHNHWWDFIAPALADRYFVVAPDLSGHGESGRRSHYAPRTWASELLALQDAVGFSAPPALVGHSMGGLVTLVTIALHGERFRGAVVIDAPVRPVDDERARKNRVAAFRNPKTYPDRDSAVAAFRLVPPQPCENDYLVRYIAGHSLRPVRGGYTWKFDPTILERTVEEPMNEHLAHPGCPLVLMVGEHSEVVTPEIAAHMAEVAGPEVPLVRVANAYHHLLLDQPEAFLRELSTRLDTWLSP